MGEEGISWYWWGGGGGGGQSPLAVLGEETRIPLAAVPCICERQALVHF